MSNINKKAVKEHSFLCRNCQAINDSPEIVEKERLVQTEENVGRGGLADEVRIQLDKTKDDLTDDEVENIKRKDNVEFENQVYWKCRVCNFEHSIGDFNV